jgi:DNA-binding transcriptional LysR family regulator
MELRQLEYFVAVAEEANFTRAAERVHISQSGISAQIRQLERELGADLIDRSGRTAVLTDAGNAALVHAHAALACADGVRRAVDEVTGLIRGRLEIGMVTGCTITPLFDAVAAFRHAHPGVEITLLEDNSERLTNHVRSGATDLALIGAAGTTPAALEAMTIVSEQLVALIPSHHELAERARITIADLDGYPLVCMPQGTGIRTVFERACASRGVRPRIALEASAPGAVTDLAARGFGVAILSESMVDTDEDRLIATVIDDIEIPALLALIWRATKSPALTELLKYARQAFAQPLGPNEPPAPR